MAEIHVDLSFSARKQIAQALGELASRGLTGPVYVPEWLEFIAVDDDGEPHYGEFEAQAEYTRNEANRIIRRHAQDGV